MAFCCPKSIRACAYRLTRYDECGQPVPPDTLNSRYQDKGFISVTVSPDIDTGEEILTKLANGDICIHDRDCDRLKGLDIELKVCGSPFPALELTLGLVGFVDGLDIVGGMLPDSLSSGCPESIGLELFSKNSGAGSCAALGGDTNAPFVQWLFPQTDNWQITGTIEFMNGAQEITVKGYATRNPNWYPSFPGPLFPSFDAPTGTYTGPPPEALPVGISPDEWTLTDQATIQAGGPMGWRCISALPDPLEYCDYAPSTLAP